MTDRLVTSAKRDADATETSLRPRTFGEYIGQREMIDNLRVSVKPPSNHWTLDHFLFAGPPGLGKTTLAHVIAHGTRRQLARQLGAGDRAQGHARVAV